MNNPDYRALCAELIALLDCFGSTFNIPIEAPVVSRARAALAHPEPVAPSNDALYSDISSTKEAMELAARLRDWWTVPLLSERERAATLLERLASDNAGLAAAADASYADVMSLLYDQ